MAEPGQFTYVRALLNRLNLLHVQVILLCEMVGKSPCLDVILYIKNMINSKIVKILLSAIVLSLVVGCSGGYETFRDNITKVVPNTETQFDYLDSLIYALAEESDAECKNLSCADVMYKPESFGFDVSSGTSEQKTYEPMTIYVDVYLDFEMKTLPFYDWQDRRHTFYLYIDIYNCNTYDCHDADKIVVHSSNYEYSRLIKPDEFSISSLKNSDIVGAKGDVSVFHHFNLKIDAKGLSLDWNIQIGQSEYEEWVDYHIDPIWG